LQISRHQIEDEPARPKIVITVVGVGNELVDPTRAWLSRLAATATTESSKLPIAV